MDQALKGDGRLGSKQWQLVVEVPTQENEGDRIGRVYVVRLWWNIYSLAYFHTFYKDLASVLSQPDLDMILINWIEVAWFLECACKQSYGACTV